MKPPINVKLALGVILVTALSLRVWGIAFGLPYVYHFDEHFYVNTALHLGRGVLNNPPYNPTLLSNILFPQYGFYYLLGKVLGFFPSPAAFEAAYRSDPSIFFLLGRLTTAVLGAATTLVLYFLGKVAANTKAGLIAAGLLAVTFLHVRDSHYAVPDVAVGFFVILAVGFAATGLRSGRRRDVYLAGLAGGLAVAMKWSAFPVAVPVGWATVCVARKEHKSVLGQLTNRTVILAGLTLVLGFALGSPQLLVNPVPYAQHLLGIQQSAAASQPSTPTLVDFNRWSFYWDTLLHGVGVVLVALGMIGALRRFILAMKSKDAISVLVLSFPIFYFFLIGSTAYSFARYLMPLLPFLALFAAEFVVVSWAAMRRNKTRVGWGLAVVMVVSAIVQPLTKSVRHDVLLTRTDTRTLAKQWIEANIPEGSKIAVDWPVHGPPLSTFDRAMPYSDKLYDVYVIGGAGLSVHPRPWYKEQGFDYLIASSYIYRRAYDGRDPTAREFFTSLEEEFPLVHVFRPNLGGSELPVRYFDEIYGPLTGLWQRVRPGPTIKIYAVQSQDR